MCLTLGKASLSNTILYGAEVKRPDGQVVHALGYQNTAQSLAGRRTGGHSGNAMMFGVPAIPGSMGRDNIINTEHFPHILEDMARAVTPVTRGEASFSYERGSKGILSPRVEVFQVGIYHLVLAEYATEDAIREALKQVPEEKRPPLKTDIFGALSKWYPDWAFLMFCFNNRGAARAHPALLWYEPSDPGELFLPALDCHTGEVPDLDQLVTVDHTVAVGSYQMKEGPAVARVNYTDVAAMSQAVRPLLLPQVVGLPLTDVPRTINGDFYVNLDRLQKESRLNLERRSPLGESENWF